MISLMAEESERNPGKATRIMLVGDDDLVRSGLKQMLLRATGFDVVAEKRIDQDVIEFVARTAPKVVVLDIGSHDENDTLRLVGRLSAASLRARPRVLMLADQHVIDRNLTRAIRLGVSGILLPGLTQDELIYAVRQVSNGHSVLQPLLTSRLFVGLRNLAPFGVEEGRGDSQTVVADLSPRERDVVAGVARGMSNQEIANEFCLTVATVKSHVSSILTKLGARDRLQAALIFLQYSLLHGER
ncbi:hypothetical protein SGFS_031390 [Streptomyces graminofaciens]|uniref:DNA-binding response regulator n=2 Tax=Streptomyces graminofaciens TaxID=68212 RepID=A0ABM7F7J7_9ACTN|nr:hypothetical protein SGFS_031390 [Streptomyces graminofaciens]